jgi:hypothetical protein
LSDVWRAEVRVPAAIVNLPDPSVTATSYADAGFYFLAVDATYTYAIRVFLDRHSSSGGTLFEYRLRVEVTVTHGLTVDFSQTLTAADGQGTAAYTAGTQLAIEKDQAEDEIRFTTPLGSVTATPSSWGGNNNDQMRPNTIGNRLRLRNPILANHQNTVYWSHFWGSQNGVRYMGAPLSADQPGSWTAWATDVVTATPRHDTDFDQETTRFKSEQSATTAGTYANLLEQWQSQWNGGDAIPRMTLPMIELARSDEHGLIWAAYAKSDYRERLLWRRSHDGGATWTDGIISEIAGQVVRNPCLYWYGPRLVACWTNGASAFQAFSHSLSEHWDGASVIGFDVGSLAEDPRLRVVLDRRHGVAYYFARAADGSLVMMPSFDLGESFGPEVTIHAAVDDAILDCTISHDSRLHVRFSVGGGYETRTSSNWGTDWSAEDTAVGLGTNPRSTEDPRSGWTFHVNWVALNTSLFAYGDPAFGLVAANFGTPAGPGLSEQVADIEMRPDGVPLVAYFAAGGEVFTTRRSFDYAQNWEV